MLENSIFILTKTDVTRNCTVRRTARNILNVEVRRFSLWERYRRHGQDHFDEKNLLIFSIKGKRKRKKVNKKIKISSDNRTNRKQIALRGHTWGGEIRSSKYVMMETKKKTRGVYGVRPSRRTRSNNDPGHVVPACRSSSSACGVGCGARIDKWREMYLDSGRGTAVTLWPGLTIRYWYRYVLFYLFFIRNKKKQRSPGDVTHARRVYTLRAYTFHADRSIVHTVDLTPVRSQRQITVD